MSFKRFKKDDIIRNTIVTHPETEFLVNNQNVFLERETSKAGSFSANVNHVPQGYLNLHELNVDRNDNSMIKPFYYYDSLREAFFGNSPQENDYESGDRIEGEYPVSASVSRIYYDHSATPSSNYKYIYAMRNAISSSGEISNSFDYGTISSADVNIIAIPSIFYGTKVKKGSVKLDFYITGSLVATLEDTYKNGELVQTYGTGLGETAGIALYDYGLFVLTGSWSLHSSTDNYFGTPGESPSWLSFGSGIDEVSFSSSQNVSSDPSYSVKFSGTTKVPTLTMMANVEKGEFNYSNNPTFIDYNNQRNIIISSRGDSYTETEAKIKNITKSKYENYEEDFENTTYISQIGIYDKDKNLIGIAKLANPVKNIEIQDYLFKLRLDF